VEGVKAGVGASLYDFMGGIMYIQGLIERAKSGNIDAQHEIARLYLSGDGVEKNIDIAKKWFLLAAEKGHAKANFELGRIHYNENDRNKARPFLESASSEGIADAQYLMGEICSFAFNEYKKAIEFYYLAARQCHCEAQYKIGCMIIQIRSLNTNDKYIIELRKSISFDEEYKWIELAADQGHVDAMTCVGSVYVLQTHPLYPDEKRKKGLEFVKRAVAKGDPYAKITLARYYEYVVGGDIGKKTAEKLYQEINKEDNPRLSCSAYNSAADSLEKVQPEYKKWLFSIKRRRW
jgi:TPR repeat protein